MFKFTKKHIALFLVLTMALSLVGCGKDKAPTSSNKGEGKFVPGVYTCLLYTSR